MTRRSTSAPHRAAIAAGWLAGATAAGAAVMAVAHSEVSVPVVSRFGPGGGRSVPVAATIFAVGALASSGVAWGLFRRRRWAWPAGVALFGVGLAGASVPYRGAGSAVAIALALAGLAVLQSRAGRAALLP